MENELISRKVPYNAAAEHAVLGAMLIDPARCVPEAIGMLTAEEFTSRRTKSSSRRFLACTISTAPSIR